jgi:uncharacterized membrane protein YgdD (TMEM256/DUF423 family)
MRYYHTLMLVGVLLIPGSLAVAAICGTEAGRYVAAIGGVLVALGICAGLATASEA